MDRAPPDSVRRQDFRAEAFVGEYLAATHRGTVPFGGRLWITPGHYETAETLGLLSDHAGGVLSPSVHTLPAVADRLVDLLGRRHRVLSPTQQRRLVAELLERADRRSSLGPLENLSGTPGLLEYVASRIRQLRLSGEPPDAVAGRLVAAEGEVGAALAPLFDRYCKELDRSDLLDAAAVYARAAPTVTERVELRLLVVSWRPRELSAVESRLLAALASVAERVVAQEPIAASLGDAAESRFGGAIGRSVAWSASAGRLSRVPSMTRTVGPAPPALDRVRRSLFSDRDEPASGVDTTTIEIVAGAGVQDEVRRVARRVKQALLDGVASPGEIVVAARSWPDRGERVAGVLDEYGIPVTLEPRRRLAAAPIASAIRQLLDVARTDWAYEPLLAALGRHEFGALAGQPGRFATRRAAAEWFVREVAAPSGRAQWLRQATSLDERAAEEPAPHSALVGSGPQAHAALRAMADALDHLPEEAAALDWFDACREALRALGYQPHASDGPALEEIERMLAEVERLDALRGRDQSELRCGGFSELLADVVERNALPRRGVDEGRVRVVSAETAVGLTMKRLYVVDLRESAFAAEAPADQEREALLFYELTTRPSESVTLSYAALDGDAQPLHPSPFITEVERLFPDGALRRAAPLLARFDSAAEPLSPREARLAAVVRATEGESRSLAAVTQSSGPSIPGALAMIAARAGGDSYGDFEGVIAQDGKAAAGDLRGRYGPDHVWSASQLELYAECPFKFFARHTLGLEPAGDPSLDVDHRRRGSVAHDALATLYSGLRDEQEVEGRPDLAPDELANRLRNAIHAAARVGSRPTYDAIIAAVEARQAEQWAERFPEQQADFDARWGALDRPLAPSYFEAKFGPARRAEGIDRAPTDEPFRFDLAAAPGVDEGERLLLAGVIDRIDVGSVAGETVFGVVDYKTARTIKTDVERIVSGHQLQPVLYALAAQRLLFGDVEATPVAAGYWGLQGKGFADAKGLAPAEVGDGRVAPSRAWLETVEAVRERVTEIVSGIRRGAFPMQNSDKDCGKRCEFRTVCRVGQTRALGKAWPPEGAE